MLKKNLSYKKRQFTVIKTVRKTNCHILRLSLKIAQQTELNRHHTIMEVHIFEIISFENCEIIIAIL